ncbi:hypothetical protein [Reinekea blandensis]|uniref:Uncharacterized protein n=1 Tax=Reinekea blandensis MED297 TaxID=314283 RepID=A4BB16_9GAMM|nr:hypothetical protein [Reinekea blandensis]EAR10629.1 hypothetical protein MED297_11455 [Reinekea sp. MED297] [Reinekea blandensis MED297]
MFRVLPWVLALLLVACSDPEPEIIQESTEFTRAAVQPDWFNRVDAEPLTSWDDVQALWASEKRCCGDDRSVVKANRVFYKSCYRAIEAKPDDVHLVPYCLWLMDVALDYDDSIQLSRYLLEHYLFYSQPTDYCANCSPADLVARTTRDVALYDLRHNNAPYDAALQLERLLDEREAQISAWVLGEIYVSLAEIYEAIPDRAERVDQLRQRVTRLEANWPEGLQAWRLEDVQSALRLLER